ncbi:MAG: hypothetical protein KY476_08605 [Planctomycetes bacterium]|nr:hypothetical protein [Planctomycetota bacterium]
MSPRSSDPQPPPPDPNIWVGLLFAAFAALVTGCVFLVLELSRYGWTAAGG